MQKKGKIILGIIVAVIIIFGIMYISLVSSKTIKAQLDIETGTVFVNGEKVIESVVLGKGDSIETFEDGLATIILYESVVVSLEPNTKINIDDLTKEHLQLSQTSGETWNTITKLFGVGDYTIKSGNSVASVRGTSFIFNVEKIIVFSGEIDYKIDNQSFKVLENNVIEKVDGEIKERGLTEEEKRKILDVKIEQ